MFRENNTVSSGHTISLAPRNETILAQDQKAKYTNLTRASLAHRNNTIFTKGQKVKYTNQNYHKTVQKLQELEESAW